MSGDQPLTGLEEVRDRLGVGIAAVVALAGWALTVLVISRGYPLRAMDFKLVPALPLAIVGTVTVLAVWKRSVDIAVWLAIVVGASVFVSLALPLAYVHPTGIWAYLLPPAMWGTDFFFGLYKPAEAFSVAGSGWPPFTLILGRAFNLLELRQAYAVMIGLTAIAAVGSAILSGRLAMLVAPKGGEPGEHGALRYGAESLGILMGCWLLTSYGFMYEVYRGNVNMLAMVLALLAVWGAIRLPRSPWWPAVALALAINLKLYPAILLVLLFWRYRWKAVLPVVVTNGVLLIIAGPANLVRLVSWTFTMTPGARKFAFADMGASGLAAVLQRQHAWTPSWIGFALVALAVALWAATAFLLIRRGWSDAGGVLLAAASVPPMAVVPTLSNDYKLVLFVLPLAVLAAAVRASRVERGRLTWALAFGLVAWLLFFMGRATIYHGLAVLGSKFFYAVLVQVLLLVLVWRLGAAVLPVGAKDADPEGAGDDAMEAA